MPITLIKEIFSSIDEKLIKYSEKNKYVEEVSQSMLFDNNFFNLFKGCICHNHCTVNLQMLTDFYHKIQSKLGR